MCPHGVHRPGCGPGPIRKAREGTPSGLDPPIWGKRASSGPHQGFPSTPHTHPHLEALRRMWPSAKGLWGLPPTPSSSLGLAWIRGQTSEQGSTSACLPAQPLESHSSQGSKEARRWSCISPPKIPDSQVPAPQVFHQAHRRPQEPCRAQHPCPCEGQWGEGRGAQIHTPGKS